MRIILGLIFLLAVHACKSDESGNSIESVKQAPATGMLTNSTQQQQIHELTVLEVIQVANYTYLRGKEAGAEIWIAAPTITAKAGDIIYYENGMLMTSFESKELNRKFDKILFVDKIAMNKEGLASVKQDSAVSIPADHGKYMTNAPAQNMGSSKDSVKQKIAIEPPKNGISVATLLKNAKTYEGKTVIVKGKVTKYTAGVMGKNWVHIQDGTEYKGKFEIVITTSAEVNNNDTVTFEGPITLNKDLGYGYFFEVLMEDGNLVK